ncbi:protein adenylyltransferase SelO [Corynebacterium halotolerans]|uniref:Protein nucleotidyltransferase YdiU n=1 Tax=Corynebacterium halotolerans YIM 70093 = DSM 44683 TaxID=1121362 RepID=M1MYD1_9CORY|nr:YdiU family protein [Corynebacterium halotolerans]AGF72744.1 hypothetical protein A605_08710 [Corynebacterium halotolerans YIM 70093 = DSM 44683]
MSTQTQLSARFADTFPELAVPWRSEEAPDPRLVVLNDALATELGLDPEWLRTPDGVAFLLGRDVPEDARPVAQGYAGHQFGQFVPRLGDGRALLLGEVTDHDGRVRDIHLKGSGPTPFSRGGDGRAVLGPMLREYLVSEAVHALGVPTTRSLAVITTGRKVQRTRVESGALLVRVAASHLRVGSFQYARLIDGSRGGDGEELDVTRRLADAAIDRHHPQARGAEQPYLALFESVMDAQASLVAQWMRLGFIHGVMNTDNTTISGETIDYGPCAFMDAFNPDTVYSSIDAQGRYAYRNQPAIIGWNLARFAETLLPLIDDNVEQAAATLQPVMNSFSDRYRAAWLRETSRSLGLPTTDISPDQEKLIDDLIGLLTEHQPDLTRFNRLLAETASVDQVDDAPVLRMFTAPGDITAWLKRWLAMSPDREAMKRVNPIYVPRNHLVEEALKAAEDGEMAPFLRLLDAVTSPFERHGRFSKLEYPAPEDFGRYVTYCGT